MTPNATYQLNVKTTPRRRICNPLEDDGGGTGRESGDILSIKHCYESAGISLRICVWLRLRRAR